MSLRPVITLFFPGLIVLGCGGATPKETVDLSKKQVVEIEELRITAKRTDDGEFDFEVYDAPDLFDKATELLDRSECEQAAALYDKLAKEFPSSRYLSASLYNAGFCLQEVGKLEEAIQRFSNLIKRLPQSQDVKDASFKVIQILNALERWDQAIVSSDQLLARTDLSSEERMEAMVYRAQALLGAKRLDEGEKQARSSLSYYRTRPEQETIRDDYFAAQANFVVAETYRLRAEAMSLPAAAVEEQREVLNRRAELILEAQRQYFNTSQFKAPRLAAASWYRIGNMYDQLWEAIMQAPIPSHLSPEAHEIYRSELAKLIEPLIRHAIRYWEATLMFIERTADHSDWSENTREEWTAKTKRDLERARQRLLLRSMSGDEPSSTKRDDSDEKGDADAGLSSQ
jgi:tetratricopeptide (TPR) repeat protein